MAGSITESERRALDELFISLDQRRDFLQKVRCVMEKTKTILKDVLQYAVSKKLQN